MDKHWGPNISSIPVAGVGGLIFAVGTALIFLVGIPALRLFLIGALVVGVFMGCGLYWYHKKRPVEIDVIDVEKRQ